MRTTIRTGINAGIVIGLILVFLVLIGFHAIAAELIAKIPGFQSFELKYSMLVFFGLMAILVGARGARPGKPDRLGHAVVGSLAAGLTAGLMNAVLVFIIGILADNGVRITMYLTSLIQASVQLYVLGLSPIQAALAHLVFFVLVAVLSGALAFGLRQTGLGAASQKNWRAFSSAVSARVGASPVARWVIYGLLLLGVFLLPLGVGDYWNYTIGTVGIYVLLGLGLNIVVGLAGLLDLGYVAFFAIGAYTVSLLTAPVPHNLQWSFWAALPIGVALAALAGILLGIPVLRMRGDYLAIVTLGFGEIIRILSRSDLLTDFSGGPRGVTNVGRPDLFGQPFGSNMNFVWLITTACLIIIFVTNRLKDSRVGRAWVAMREDETVARANGINILTHKLLAFAIGAAFAGLGGVLFASRNAFTGPEDHNLMVSINVLALVIVGGMGSIPGVIAGALVLKGLPEVLRQLETYRLMFFGALLVIMMIIRPEGIIPSSRRKLELSEKNVTEPPPAPGEPDIGEANLPHPSESEGEAPA